MTDNEIIKALELCHTQDGSISCYDCPCYDFNKDECKGFDHTDLLDLINGLIAAQETLQKHLAEKNAEIERLKNAYKQCAWERDTFLEEISKTPKANTSVSLIDGHIESDFDSKAFWEDTH